MSGLRTEKADLGTAALALVALSIVVCAADWAAARGGGGGRGQGGCEGNLRRLPILAASRGRLGALFAFFRG